MTSKRGRPPIDPTDHTVSTHVRLPSREFDALCQLAQREHLSLPELIRRALARDRREDEGGDD
jgi:hypothetical protein